MREIKTFDKKLFQILIDVVKNIGVKNTCKYLEAAKRDETNVIVSLLITDVCKEYNINRDILFGIDTRGNRKAAISTIVYLMCQHLGLVYSQLYIYLPIKVSNSSIRQYIRFIAVLDPKFKHEQEIITKLNKVEAKLLLNIKQYKNSEKWQEQGEH